MSSADSRKSLTSQEKLRHRTRERLRYIEFRLFWDGQLSRQDLTRRFGISVPQASADIASYRKIAPTNLRYDATRKRYLPSGKFSPLLFQPSSDEYLAQLQLVAEKIADEHWLGELPSVGVIPRLPRRIAAPTLRALLSAIRSRSSILVRYQSFSGPNPTDRWISPHAFAFDGHRWHVRAWCDKRKGFADFVIARILEIRSSRSSDIDPATDVEWATIVTLRIGPHPDLPPNHRKVIELDYGMADGVLEVRSRLALAYYLERRLNLDLGPEQVTPERQQIVLLNRKELIKMRSEVTGRASQP